MKTLVAVGAVTAVLVGCNASSGEGECHLPPEGCPRSTFTTQMTAGTLAYQIGAATSATSVPITSQADGACTTLGLDGEVFKDEFVNTSGPLVHCTTSTGEVNLVLEKLGDPRAWPVGTRTFGAAEAGLVVEVSECRKGVPCLACKAAVADARVTVVVEEAAGAAAPYPRMVTADYRRTYRIELDTGTRSTANGVSSCPSLAVALSLHLEQTAARFVDDPHGACMPCS